MAATPTPSTHRTASTPSWRVCAPRPRLLCRERRIDTNSTQTSADPHRVHECLAFRIVKEQCSFSSLAPSGSHDRNAAAARNRQVPPATPPHRHARASCAATGDSPPLTPDLCLLTPEWWSWTGSNRRPPACKAGALPTELQPRRQLSVVSRQLSVNACPSDAGSTGCGPSLLTTVN